jgi:hypothetical protein
MSAALQSQSAAEIPRKSSGKGKRASLLCAAVAWTSVKSRPTISEERREACRQLATSSFVPPPRPRPRNVPRLVPGQGQCQQMPHLRRKRPGARQFWLRNTRYVCARRHVSHALDKRPRL